MRALLVTSIAALTLLTGLAFGEAERPTPKPAAAAPTPPAAGSDLATSGPVHIARWKGDRQAALSLTFDDGLADQLTYALPALNQAGLKATFALNPGNILPTRKDAEAAFKPDPAKKDQVRSTGWDEWAAVLAAGHEIANHSMTHPWLNKLDAAQLSTEITASQTLLEQKLKTKVVTFIVPFNALTPSASARTRKTHLFVIGSGRADYGYNHDAAYHNKLVDAALAKNRRINNCRMIYVLR